MADWRSRAEDFSRRHISVCHCGGVGYVRTNAPIGHPLFGKAIPCLCTRDSRARERAQELRRRSGISSVELSAWTFESFQANKSRSIAGRDDRQTAQLMGAIKRHCEAYAANPSGWLILCGVPGSGKTHLAYAIAAAQLAKDHAIYASTVSELMNLLRSSFSIGAFDAWFSSLRDVHLLILDDFGAQRDTEWVMDTLFQLINWRYARRLPMVVTTNAAPGSAESGVEPRIASRMNDGSQTTSGFCKVLTLPCGDFRPTRRLG